MDTSGLLVETFQNDRWLSNTYLVAAGPGGPAVLVDSGAPTEPLWRRIEELGLQLQYVLCTHHHPDHVLGNRALKERTGCSVAAHALDADRVPDVDLLLEDRARLLVGELSIEALHTPGHTRGQLAFRLNDTHVCTGDTLFRRSVGGTRGPGHGTFAELRRSILDVLLALPGETVVLPGHTEATTVAEELEENPFVRLWRGLDAPRQEPCEALGEPATLLLRARDYDGGTKCLVRFREGEEGLEVLPGSRVREGG